MKKRYTTNYVFPAYGNATCTKFFLSVSVLYPNRAKELSPEARKILSPFKINVWEAPALCRVTARRGVLLLYGNIGRY